MRQTAASVPSSTTVKFGGEILSDMEELTYPVLVPDELV